MVYSIDYIRKTQLTFNAIRLIIFIFDIFCIFSSYESIEKNSIFNHYCTTLFSIFCSISNSMRYEYIYLKNYGKRFQSIEDYKSWKMYNFKSLKYFFAIIEYFFKITFFYHSFPIRNNNLYSISILLLHLNVISFIIFLKLSIIYLIYTITLITFKKIYWEIYKKIDLNRECSICLQSNNNYWIKTWCEHEFHEECIKKWIQIKMCCPLCRSFICKDMLK